MENCDQTVRAILARPYTRRLLPDPTGGYSVTVKEFPGCIAEGDSAEEALSNFDAAASSWIAVCLEDGYTIAEPTEPSMYSGRIALRVPPGLHEDIAELAGLDECSVNQLLAVAISEYVGRRQGVPPMRGTRRRAAIKRDTVDAGLATK